MKMIEYTRLKKDTRRDVEGVISASLGDLTDYDLVFILNYIRIATVKRSDESEK